MPTIAKELQSIEDDLKIILPHGEATKLYLRRRQLYDSVCAVKTWQDGNTNKRIVTVSELSSLIGQVHTDWTLEHIGYPGLFHEENLTLSWTGELDWPFVFVSITNSQDKDDCFKWNSERMEAP